MSEINLPKQWIEVALDDVVDKIVGGGTPSKTVPSYFQGNIPWMTVKDMNKFVLTDTVDHISEEAVKNSATNIIPAGTPIIATRMSLGKMVRANFDSAINQDLKAIFINENVSNIYFEYWYRSISHKIQEMGTGTTVKGIRLEDIKQLSFAVAPLAEQQQIAQKLDELLAQVDALKTRLDTIPKILKRFRQSVLAAAVSGGLTEEWRRSDEYELKGNKYLPLSWKSEQAQNVCLKVQSGSTPRDNPFDQNGTVPFLKVYNIVNQKIDFNYKPQFVTAEVHEKSLKRSIALPNDILMNIVGPPLGKIAILTNQYPEWNLNQAITLFRTNPEFLQFMYLYYVLCEGELVRDVMPETKGSVGQVNISLSQCRDALIPVPPLKEQTEIVRRVEQIFAHADQIEKRVKDAQARVNHLTQSILAKAFRGELTAEWRAQNPELISGENSAAALLERIKVERDIASNKRKIKK